MKRICFILILFLLCFPIVNAQHITEEKNDSLGIAVYGQCINSFFNVAVNQTLNTSFNVKNVSNENISVSIELSEHDALEILVSDESFNLSSFSIHLVFLCLKVLYDISLIDLMISVSALSINTESVNSVSTSIVAHTYFLIDAEASILNLNVYDQYERPYAGLDLSLVKDALLYNTAKTGASGFIKFILASGTYTINAYKEGMLLKSVDLFVNGTTNATIYVERTIHIIEDNFYTFNIVELMLGMFIGYCYKAYKGKKEKCNINWSSLEQ